MAGKILEGKSLAGKIEATLRQELHAYQEQGFRMPGIAVILLGDDPASKIYVNNKLRASAALGLVSKPYFLPQTTDEQTLLDLIHTLNHDPSIDGILIQLPLPQHIDNHKVVEALDPKKDVDGFHPYNLGRLAQGRPFLRPCTPAGIMLLLNSTGIRLTGLDALVIGVSNIVGRPMILELLMAGCTVTAAQRSTQNLQERVQNADILIVATGNPHLIKGAWIKPNSIVIDVGINRLDTGQLVGDVEFESAVKKAAWITPVPGGVGPLTVAMLLKNTLMAYSNLYVANKM